MQLLGFASQPAIVSLADEAGIPQPLDVEYRCLAVRKKPRDLLPPALLSILHGFSTSLKSPWRRIGLDGLKLPLSIHQARNKDGGENC